LRRHQLGDLGAMTFEEALNRFREEL